MRISRPVVMYISAAFHALWAEQGMCTVDPTYMFIDVVTVKTHDTVYHGNVLNVMKRNLA